jgi:hypothetical protein
MKSHSGKMYVCELVLQIMVLSTPSWEQMQSAQAIHFCKIAS